MKRQKWNEPDRLLLACPVCNKKSVVRKVYTTQGIRKRVEYCIQRKCGYRQDLPFPETYLRKEGAVC